MIPVLAINMPGGPELIIIFLVVLLLFGAKKLPDLAKALGRSTMEFKKARQEVEDEISRAQSDLKLEEAKDKQPHRSV